MAKAGVMSEKVSGKADAGRSFRDDLIDSRNYRKQNRESGLGGTWESGGIGSGEFQRAA